MKKAKKLFAMAVAVIMALALAVPAFAAVTPQGRGSITIENATENQTYAAYKIFDVTYTTVEDEVYQSYRIGTDNQFYSVVAGRTDLFTLTATSDSTVYTVEPAEGKDADILTWLGSLIPEEGNTYIADFGPTTAENATVTWSDVPYGYYLITSSLGALVTVNQNTPDVTVIDKNQDGGSKLTKTADDDTVQIGEPVDFTASFTATNYDGETKITEYTITDTMATGMELVGTKDNLTVTIRDGEDVLDTLTYDVSGTGFDIKVPWQADGAFKYSSPVTVEVTYTAVLTSEATIAGNGNVNSIEVTWTGNPDGDEITTTETVSTYALAIKKIDPEGHGLAGATFVLKDAQGTEITVSGSNGEYVVDPKGTATIVSPESGLIIIRGVDSDDYTLTETAAPAGYNLLGAPVPVKPVETTQTSTNTTLYLDAEGNVVDEDSSAISVVITADVAATAYAVMNSTGTQLPTTGGMGTTVFYVIGGVLMAGAAILLVTKKKMAQ